MSSKLIFVTGNKDKLEEAEKILDNFEVENVKLDLPELQGHRDVVIKEKVKLACEKLGKACFVDDTSLCFNALNDLPGVYTKDFIERIGKEGLVRLLGGFDDKSAKAVCMIGYCKFGKEPVCFEGIVKGKIVNARGERFDWDAIFQPDGYKQTFAEMEIEEKNKFSHRRKALMKFKEFLDNEV